MKIYNLILLFSFYTAIIFCSENNLMIAKENLEKTDQHKLLTCRYCINTKEFYRFGIMLELYINNITKEQYFYSSEFFNQITHELIKTKTVERNINIPFLKTLDGKDIPGDTYCNINIFNQKDIIFFNIHRLNTHH